MKQLFALASVVLTLGVLQSGTAMADVSSLQLDAKGTLSASKTTATVTGTIVCDAGDEVEITVIISQSSGKVDAVGSGEPTLICTGDVQSWTTTVDVVIGSAFKHGPAVVLFDALDITTSVRFPTETQRIKL